MNTSQLLLILMMGCGVTCLSLPELLRPQRAGNDVSLFKVKITESGTTFNEELEIDSRENTVTFHIAPHNNVDLSDIMYMFELNLTIYRFPIKGVCYLAPLKRDQPPPEKLENDMSKFQASHDQEIDDKDATTTEASSYLITGKLTDLQHWDPRIESFCRGLDVYLVEIVDKKSLTIESDDDEGRRERRQTNSKEWKCPWPQNQQNDCPFDRFQSKCYTVGQSCTYFRNCWFVYNRNKRKFETQCVLKHVFDDIICCKRTCPNPVTVTL